MAIILDGNKQSKAVYEQLKEQIALIDENNRTYLGVAILLVGNDPSSKVYVNMIINKCKQIGIYNELFTFEDTATTDEVVECIHRLNHDSRFSGIIVQFPVPKHFDSQLIREAIAPLKDVDSAGSANIGKFFSTNTGYVPCTPKSMHRLLKSLDLQLTGKHAVVVGRSLVVGKPVADLMLGENMTVTICHSKTQDLAVFTKEADVLLACVGVAHLITADMVKEGALVIDAGINVLEDQLVGDVDYKDVEPKAYAITPVPGGVGPMTIAMLMENILLAFNNQHGRG